MKKSKWIAENYDDILVGYMEEYEVEKQIPSELKREAYEASHEMYDGVLIGHSDGSYTVETWSSSTRTGEGVEIYRARGNWMNNSDFHWTDIYDRENVLERIPENELDCMSSSDVCQAMGSDFRSDVIDIICEG